MSRHENGCGKRIDGARLRPDVLGRHRTQGRHPTDESTTPPQDYHTKQMAGEIMTLVEEAKKWINMLDTVKTQSSDKIDDYGYRCRVWFHDWLPENRKVAEMFASLSLQAKRSGREHFGAQCIYETMRYKRLISEKNSDFKLNNNHVALLARYTMAKYKELDNFFSLRTINGLPETTAHHIF